MSAGLVPPEIVRETLFHVSSLVSSGLLSIFGVPSFADATLPSLASGSQDIHPVYLCRSMCTFPLHKDTSSVGLGTHLTPVQPHLN